MTRLPAGVSARHVETDRPETNVLETDADRGGSYTEAVVDGAGHSPRVERPDHVASVLTDFLSA